MLIVVPASLRLAWAEELAKWLPQIRPSQVHVIEGRTDRLSGSSIPQVGPVHMKLRQICERCRLPLESSGPLPTSLQSVQAFANRQNELCQALHTGGIWGTSYDRSFPSALSVNHRCMQIVITSYDMLMRLSCKICKKEQSRPGAACTGPENCMAARGFKVCCSILNMLVAHTHQGPHHKHDAIALLCLFYSCQSILLLWSKQIACSMKALQRASGHSSVNLTV